MHVQDLKHLLQHPEAVTGIQTDSLAEYLKTYPYFQALRAIHLKGLKQKNSFKYNNALKITAAYTTDRSVLFDYITSEVFNQNEISNQIKQNSEHLKILEVNDVDDISVNKSVTIDDALKAHIRATEGVLDPELFTEKAEPNRKVVQGEIDMEEDTNAIIAVDVDNITPEEKLNIGKPLDFDKNENHSFTEWLKITSFKPIKREVTDKKEETFSSESKKQQTKSKLQSKMDRIDKFISENPKIKPSKDILPQPRLISDNNPQSDHLMTETLARIYLEQKNYDKAIQSYKILSLKYPEKSSFFADQIKAVQELKDNNTIQ